MKTRIIVELGEGKKPFTFEAFAVAPSRAWMIGIGNTGKNDWSIPLREIRESGVGFFAFTPNEAVVWELFSLHEWGGAVPLHIIIERYVFLGEYFDDLGDLSDAIAAYQRHPWAALGGLTFDVVHIREIVPDKLLDNKKEKMKYVVRFESFQDQPGTFMWQGETNG